MVHKGSPEEGKQLNERKAELGLVHQYSFKLFIFPQFEDSKTHFFIKMTLTSILIVLLVLQISFQASAFKFSCKRKFSPISPIQRRSVYFQSPSGDNGGDETGYGPVGSLLRQGPVPYFIRLIKPDTYDAAVKKYMQLEKVSRVEAMANMDAYFQDPNGWAANKLKERNGGYKADYVNANVDKKSLILTGIWSLGLLAMLVRIIYVQVIGNEH